MEKLVKYHENGQKKLECFYRNGNKEGREIWWHEDGKKRKERFYNNGKLEGRETWWHENGKKRYECFWKNGMLEGKETRWNEKGEKEMERFWRNGKQDGKEIFWYTNGWKWSEFFFKNGKTEGIVKWWYSDGQKQTESFYKNDEIEGEKIDYEYKNMKVIKNYYIEGVQFPSIDDYIRIKKLDSNFTYEELKRIFAKRGNKDATKAKVLKKLWNKLKPYDTKEAFQKFRNNTEQLMIVCKYLGPERIFKELGSELIDKETVHKKQKKAFIGVDGSLFTKEIEYDDTYELYKIDKDKLGTIEDAYIVKYNCPSTNKTYYTFVEKHDKAVEAIASTFRKPDGKPLTMEEYLTMESET